VVVVAAEAEVVLVAVIAVRFMSLRLMDFAWPALTFNEWLNQ
jgi:hypothetical protein